MAMAARPGAVDKAYMVGSSLSMRLKLLLTSVRCHGWNVAYFPLTLEGATGLVECARTLDVCPRARISMIFGKHNEPRSDLKR